jgi:two-component system heavy metal sensor histidine kinase CusS
MYGAWVTCLKNDRNAIERLRPRHWSITYRLSLYFALSSLVLIAVMGIYLDTTLDRRLDDEHSVFLADDVNLIREALAKLSNDAVLAGNARWPEALTLVASRLHVTILDEDKKVLATASPLTVPLSVLPAPAEIGQRADRVIMWESPEGKYYRLVTAWAGVGRTGTRKALIVLALDISIEHRLLEGYRDTLLVTLLAGVLCAATLGYVITRRGLAPIRRIAKTASQITSARLDRKLDLVDSPVELRELAAAFNDMLDRLHASFSRLSQFSSDIAHELRTPINNLMGEAQVALSRARTAEDYREVLESNVEEYERLSRMIENMLFLARADDPQTKISPVRLDARAESEKLAEFYQVVADESGARIRCTGGAAVYADSILYRRAISNLLSNALRHTARGGEIVLEVGTQADGWATTAVTNPGLGIPAEHRARIFDRLYRVEPSREKTTAGAGLGLAIVKSIMELHRGNVSVASFPDGPTIFTLRFPPAAKTTA